MLQMVPFARMLALAGLLFFPASGQADLIIFDGGGPVQPSELVQFNQPGVVPGPATVVTGVTQQSGFKVSFESTDDPQFNLFANGGQSRVERADTTPQDPTQFSSIRIFSADIDFSALEFKIDVQNPVQGEARTGLLSLLFTFTDSTTFTATTTGNGVDGTPLSVASAGDNFFGITSDKLISSVTLTVDSTTAGDDLIVQSLRQVRVDGEVRNGNPGGGGGDPPPAVPEPASMLLWGVGGLTMAALGARRARRRNRSSSES